MSCRVNFFFLSSLAVVGGVTGVTAVSRASLYGPIAPPAGPYPASATAANTTAIPFNSPVIQEWASSAPSFIRGPQDIANPNGPLATVGTPSSAFGPADGSSVVSLGDGGSITLGFAQPIVNGPGPDLAVFENGFLSGGPGQAFLELAFVDVSSDGTHFARFPAVSLTPTTPQIGGFGLLSASNLYDLAGNYVAKEGTPFDLGELAGVPNVDINDINYVRITDVVGRVTPVLDSSGNVVWSPSTDYFGNIINDPYSTPSASSGFDLDAVGVLNADVPESASMGLLMVGGSMVLGRRNRTKRVGADPLTVKVL